MASQLSPGSSWWKDGVAAIVAVAGAGSFGKSIADAIAVRPRTPETWAPKWERRRVRACLVIVIALQVQNCPKGEASAGPSAFASGLIRNVTCR